MTTTARAVVAAGSGALLVALVALASTGTVGAVTSLVLAAGLLALVWLGPDRFGQALVLAGVFTAPMNSVRPIAGADAATFSDLFLFLGFALLVPRMLSGRARVSALHLAASLMLVCVGAVSSLLNANTATSFFYLVKMMTGLILLPLAFQVWRPSAERLRWLVWAYVLGQLVSLLDGVAGSRVGGRFLGLTTHPNFFGICSMLAAALCLYLISTAPVGRRVWPVLACGGCLLSVVLSGSRAALLATVVIAIVFPVLERSARAGYLVVAAGTLAGASAGLLLDRLGPDSAIGRLAGEGTSQGSDAARMENLTSAWHTFLQNPLGGTGFQVDTAFAHNGYLEVATAFGILGAVAYGLLLWSMVRTILRNERRNLLGYAALGYAFVSFFNNTLWDRFAWVALSLVLVADQVVARPPQVDQPRRLEDVPA
ncbi:MAG TPA: O-antigen ligase family protein [Marmoricola sp.]|nr:O-antigen ligase family protein [Marmoricola sp.]